MFNLKIDILSYWLAGTGRGSGGSYDEKPLVDENGIPYIPGKHLKGLLKDGLRSWAKKTGTENSDIQCFGSDQDEGDEKTTSGVLRVSSATFDQAEYKALKTDKKRISKLFKSLSSTAIDKNGIADNKSLRTQQVVIPVTLYAQLEWKADSPYAKDTLKDNLESHIEQACAMLPAIGSKRTRGLGRCKIAITTEIENENKGGDVNV